MKDAYDVLVVGGGPGGAVAAKTAAEAGLSVLLVEKRPAVGVPVRCAERISKAGLSEFLEADPRWISAETDSAVLVGSDGTKVLLDEEAFYTLDCKVFDRELVWRAAEAGAEIQVHARATAPILENGQVVGAVIQQHGKTTAVNAKVVIAADGIESTFAKRAGIDTTVPVSELGSCAQYVVNDIDIEEHTLLYFVSDAEAPGGYIWIFPKGCRCANIGVMIQGTKAHDGYCARDYLDSFVKKQYPNGKITEMAVGGVSRGSPLACTVSDGLMIVGAAAHISTPVTEGMYAAMVTGRLAGEVAAAAIHAGDVSKEALMVYDRRWREKIIWSEGSFQAV